MKKSLVLASLLTSTALFSSECGVDPSYLFEVRYRDPKGVGYDKGYSSATFFFSPSSVTSCTPFIDLRGHAFNNGMWAANGGLGVRKTFGNFIGGLNGYYDYRDICYLGGQNRLGAGAELLSKWADLRLNGYAPFGDSKFATPACFSHFACHSAFASQTIAATLPSIDLELGAPAPGFFEEVNLYGALGTYYLFERDVAGFELGKAWGVRGRVDLRIFDGIRIGADVTYDKIFHTRAQGYIGLSIPLGPSNMRTKSACFKENYRECPERALSRGRELQPVYRQEIIPSEQENLCFPIVPCGGLNPSFPEFPNFPNFPGFNPNGTFVFVRNTASSGNGTFERPYPTLLDAALGSAPGDIIYVFYGDGTSKGQDQGMILQNNQAFFSSGISFDLGGIVIPPVDPGTKPKIVNNSRQNSGTFFGVELANRNAVAGFLFDGMNTPNFVAADVRTANSFIFNSNQIVNTPNPIVTKTGDLTGAQILIANNSASTGVIFNSTINSSRIGIISNTFTAPTASDAVIYLLGSSVDSTIQISDNLFENSGVVDIEVGTVFTRYPLTNSLLSIIGNHSTKLGDSTAAILGFVAGTKSVFSNNRSENTGTDPLLYSAFILLETGEACVTGNHFDWDFSIQLFENSCLHLADNVSDPGAEIYIVPDTLFNGDIIQVEVLNPKPGNSPDFSGLNALNPNATITVYPAGNGIYPTQVAVGTCGCANGVEPSR